MQKQISSSTTIHLPPGDTLELLEIAEQENPDGDTWVLNMEFNSYPHGRHQVTVFGDLDQMRVIQQVFKHIDLG